MVKFYSLFLTSLAKKLNSLPHWSLHSKCFYSLESSRQPISFPQRSSKWLHTLPSIQDIHKHFNLHDVHFWRVLEHNISPHTHTHISDGSILPLVDGSQQNITCRIASCQPSSIEPLWKAGRWPKSCGPFCNLLWHNMQLSSRDFSHQADWIHRTHVAPRTMHELKALISPNCISCTQNVMDPSLYVGWEGAKVAEFWKRGLRDAIKQIVQNNPSRKYGSEERAN